MPSRVRATSDKTKARSKRCAVRYFCGPNGKAAGGAKTVGEAEGASINDNNHTKKSQPHPLLARSLVSELVNEAGPRKRYRRRKGSHTKMPNMIVLESYRPRYTHVAVSSGTYVFILLGVTFYVSLFTALRLPSTSASSVVLLAAAAAASATVASLSACTAVALRALEKWMFKKRYTKRPSHVGRNRKDDRRGAVQHTQAHTK